MLEVLHQTEKLLTLAWWYGIVLSEKLGEPHKAGLRVRMDDP